MRKSTLIISQQACDVFLSRIAAATEALVGVVLLLAGCAVYLLFRSKGILLCQWFAAAAGTAALDTLRQAAAGWEPSPWMRYSLPDGLFCASYLLIMDALWRRSRPALRYLMVAVMPVAALVHECLQGMGAVRGTFDTADLLCYLTPLVIYFTVQYLFHQSKNFSL